MARIGLVNGNHRQLVAEGFHRKEEIGDLGNLLTQDRRINPVQGDGQHRLLLRWTAAEGGEEHRIASLRHAVEPHKRGVLHAAVKTHVVAKRTIRADFPGGDRSFQHHFAVAGNLQIDGFARCQAHAFPRVNPGEEPFAELHRNRGCCRHHQQGMHANGDSNL